MISGDNGGDNGFVPTSIQIEYNKNKKIGDYESCKAGISISAILTRDKNIADVSKQIFAEIEVLVSEQLNKALPQQPQPQQGVGKPGQGTRQASGKTGRGSHQRESGDGGEKLATAQQGKKIWAMLYNQGLSKDEIVQKLEEKFGTSDIAENVSVGDASDFIEELQSAAV